MLDASIRSKKLKGPPPQAVLTALQNWPNPICLDSSNGRMLLSFSTAPLLKPSESFEQMIRDALEPRESADGHPFAGGVMGYVSYESGRFFEQMPSAIGPLPLQEFGLRRYEGSLVFEKGIWWIAGTEAFLQKSSELLSQAETHLIPSTSTWVGDEEPPQHEFLEAVEEVLARISRGDCYQVNVARCLKFRPQPALLPLFLRLRKQHPARFGALLLLDDAGVVSNSPELFLRVEGELVETMPIKGTRPKTPGACEQLRSSEKERAELTMIVDMARNDLARCCSAGSVVAEAREVVELPSLYHAQQRVRGRLRRGCDAVDAFAACFPPASVTGAPKVKAMEVIRELEPVPRGVYTGAVGYFSDDGNACFSVAIRTLMACSGEAWLHVGSGIVADSRPEEELAESGWKAAAFVDALVGKAVG